MKNRNIQFKTTARLLIPLFLACFAAVFTSATTPVSARDQVPFNEGNAMHLGRFNGTAEFVLNVCNLTYVGSYVFTGANGDSISGPFTGP
jgi:hypothetical protein